VVCLFAMVAAVAPARRATGVSAMAALRAEETQLSTRTESLTTQDSRLATQDSFRVPVPELATS
jgi:hypothetical protein